MSGNITERRVGTQFETCEKRASGLSNAVERRVARYLVIKVGRLRRSIPPLPWEKDRISFSNIVLDHDQTLEKRRSARLVLVVHDHDHDTMTNMVRSLSGKKKRPDAGRWTDAQNFVFHEGKLHFRGASHPTLYLTKLTENTSHLCIPGLRAWALLVNCEVAAFIKKNFPRKNARRSDLSVG